MSSKADSFIKDLQKSKLYAKCPFCYNPPITPELLRRELSFEDAARSLYSGSKNGARLLNLHGGEVTLRDDLPKILALSKKLGFKQITVVTNGVRLKHLTYVRRLVTAGATHFRLSIHSAEAPIHDSAGERCSPSKRRGVVGVRIDPGIAERLRAMGYLR